MCGFNPRFLDTIPATPPATPPPATSNADSDTQSTQGTPQLFTPSTQSKADAAEGAQTPAAGPTPQQGR